MGRGVPNREERSIVCEHDGTDPILRELGRSWYRLGSAARGYDDEANLVCVRGVRYAGDALPGECTDGAIDTGGR